MTLPKLQYIQRFEVHERLMSFYTDFVIKLVAAHKKLGIEKQWTVYENTFKPIRETREFIFIRELTSWSDLDEFEKEDPLPKILMDAYGKEEGLQLLDFAKKSIKKITTEVISKIDKWSLM